MFYNKNMRIKNKYLRNRHARIKAWNKAKKIEGGEFSQKWSNPYWFHGMKYASVEEQQKDHVKWIEEWWVRGFLNGNNRGGFHAPKWYKLPYKRRERRLVKKVLDRMSRDVDNVDGYIIPSFKQDADWNWF